MSWIAEEYAFGFQQGKEFFLFSIVFRLVLDSATCYEMGTGAPSLEIKWLQFEADHSPQSRAKVKSMWICTPTTYISYVCVYVCKHSCIYVCTCGYGCVHTHMCVCSKWINLKSYNILLTISRETLIQRIIVTQKRKKNKLTGDWIHTFKFGILLMQPPLKIQDNNSEMLQKRTCILPWRHM